LYSNNNMYDTIKNINNYLYESIKQIGSESCPPGSDFWENFFKNMIEIIYHCLYESIYLVFFIIVFIVYLVYLNSTNCKIVFSIIHAFFIIAIGIVTYYSKIKDILKKMNESYE